MSRIGHLHRLNNGKKGFKSNGWRATKEKKKKRASEREQEKGGDSLGENGGVIPSVNPSSLLSLFLFSLFCLSLFPFWFEQKKGRKAKTIGPTSFGQRW